MASNVVARVVAPICLLLALSIIPVWAGRPLASDEAPAVVNKRLTSPPLPLQWTVGYNDDRQGTEDSVAVWPSPNGTDSLLFVTQKAGNRVDIWNLQREQIIRELPGFNRPNGVAVDRDEGTVYVTDRLNHSLRKYRITEILQDNMQPALVFGSEFSRSPEPMGLAIHHNKDAGTLIFVTYEGSSEKFVRAFRSDGTLSHSWSLGTDFSVESIAVDDDHRLVFVANEAGRSIKVFTTDGMLARQFGNGSFAGEAEGIVIYRCGLDGYIIVSDQKANEFDIFDRISFEYLASFKIAKVSDTDGIALSQGPLPNYPMGAFFSQSSDKQVFGISWSLLAEKTGMTTCLP